MPNQSTCGQCLQGLNQFDATYAAFDYRDLIKTMINKLKFNQQYYQATWLSDLWLERFSDTTFNIDVIIPVPLHRRRLRKRGYNQAALLAKRISKKRQLPVSLTGVVRQCYTEPQTSLPAKQRQRINASYFNSHLVGIKRVAMVDDVMTTGSTLNALATCLKRQGVEHIENWVIARTLKH